MSRFAIVPDWLVQRASGTALRLWCLLAIYYADRETRECWPARQTLAQALGVSLATVDRSLAELRSIGALDVWPRRDPRSGGQMTNVMRLRDPRGTPPEPPHNPPSNGGESHQNPITGSSLVTTPPHQK